MTYINPRIFAALEPRFSHRCAVLTLETDIISTDETNPTWEISSGQAELKCVVGPASVSVNDPHFSETIGTLFFVDLLGFHQVTPSNQVKVTFDNEIEVTYAILGVQPDGVGLSTRLLCKTIV